MKIAVSSIGKDMEAGIDPRFGRAKYFVVYEPDRGHFEVIDNSINLNAAQGAGIQTAQRVVASGAGVLISGNCGPKAFQVLNAAGVKVFTSDAKNVMEAVALFSAGKLTQISSANVEGHWL